jgi:virulence-associated protein VagC
MPTWTVDASHDRRIAILVAMRTKSALSEPAVTVRVFTNGGSQAVTIPREFRLSTKRATVRRHGDALIITPATEDDSWDDLWKNLQPLDGSFRRWPTGPAEKRPSL